MNDSPSIDALIKYRKTVRPSWNGIIEQEISRAFHCGYAAGMASGDLPPATRDLLREVRDYLACQSTLYNVEAKLAAFEEEWRKGGQ